MKKQVLFFLSIALVALLMGCSKENLTNTPEVSDNSLQNNTSVSTRVNIVAANTSKDNTSKNIEANTSSDDAGNISETNNTISANTSDPSKTTTTPSSNLDACKSGINERCAGPPLLNCVGDATLDLSKNTVSFTVKNTLTQDIRITGLAAYNEDDPWACMTRITVENVMINSNGELIDINDMPIIQVGDSFQIIMTYSGLDKEYVNQGFELTYDIDSEGGSKGYFRIEALQ